MASNNAFTLSGATPTSTSTTTPSGGVSSNSDFLSLLAPSSSTLTATNGTMPSTTLASAYPPGSVSGLVSPTSSTSATSSTPAYNGTSIVDYLNSTGADSSYAHRAQLAAQYGIQNYTGTADQNTQLLAMLNKPTSQTATNTATLNNSTPQTTWSGLVSGATPVSSLYSSAPTTQNVTPPAQTIPPYTPPAQTQPLPSTQQNTPTSSLPTPQQNTIPSSQATTASDLSRTGTLTGLLGYSQATDPYASQINDVNKQIANLRASLADQTAGINNEGIPLEFKQGRGQVLQTQEAQKEAALSGQLNALVAARGQGEGAASTAAGLNQPFQQPYNSQLVTYDAQGNPVVGAGGTNTLQSAVTNVAQKVQNGTMTYDQAVSALSGYGQGGVNALQQVLGPNFNTNVSNAQGGVAAGQAQQIAGYQSALQQGQNLASQATDLISKFGLNPSELNVANGAIQAIARNTSNPYYQELNNYLADISSRYSQILTPPGGSATDTTRAVASGMLNALASGKSIADVLASLDQQAKAVIAGVSTTPNTGSNSSGETLFGSFF